MSHFTQKKTVEFHHTDLAGIVHFSEYFRYFESAEHAMFRSLGLSVHEADSGLGWPRVSCSFEFQASLGFEDEFEVGVTIERIGDSSLQLSCEVRRGETVIAKGQSTCVCCRRDARGRMRKTAIPERFRAKLEELQSASS